MPKSFADKMKDRAASNPALMFISHTDSEPEAEAPAASPTPDTGRRTPTMSESAAHKRIREQEASPLQAQDRVYTAPQRREYKSRRLQLLIQPSLYDAIKDRAEAEGLSVNEEIHELLRQALGE